MWEALKKPKTQLVCATQPTRASSTAHRDAGAHTLDTNATQRRLRTPCGDTAIELVPVGDPTRS